MTVSKDRRIDGAAQDDNRRNNTAVIHRGLKQQILTGERGPGSYLSQVQIAKSFGVSRGPVREALRLLEREGLIETEVNHRSRVVPFSVEDLEQLYATRIVTEALCLSVSVPRFSDAQLTDLEQMLVEMEGLIRKDLEEWERVHRRFHLALVEPAGDRMIRLVDQFIDHSERYRRVYVSEGPRAWSAGAAEHGEIVRACLGRQATLASVLLARHLSRTALTVFMTAAPEHEPALVRGAVRQVADATDLPEGKRLRSIGLGSSPASQA